MVVIEVKLPQSWEDGIDLVLARVRRLRRRTRINWIRKMSIMRAEFRNWIEGLQRDDERPIIKRGRVLMLCLCLILFLLDSKVNFEDVDLTKQD